LEKIDIQIVDKDLVPQACIDFVTNPSSGGIDVFIGTVRNQTKGKRVVQLDFEAYVPMAISEMRKIAEQACEKWPIEKMSMHIDTLKETVPIWKKEIFEDGEVWVAAHP